MKSRKVYPDIYVDKITSISINYLNKNNIHYDIQDHQFGAYIAGINNIYEFDAGKNSGWMYKVNGVLPNYGVGSYKLKDGDSILLFYTVDYTK